MVDDVHRLKCVDVAVVANGVVDVDVDVDVDIDVGVGGGGACQLVQLCASAQHCTFSSCVQLCALVHSCLELLVGVSTAW